MKISKGLLNPYAQIFYVDLDLKDGHVEILYKFNLPNAKIPSLRCDKFLKNFPNYHQHIKTLSYFNLCATQTQKTKLDQC